MVVCAFVFVFVSFALLGLGAPLPKPQANIVDPSIFPLTFFPAPEPKTDVSTAQPTLTAISPDISTDGEDNTNAVFISSGFVPAAAVTPTNVAFSASQTVETQAAPPPPPTSSNPPVSFGELTVPSEGGVFDNFKIASSKASPSTSPQGKLNI
ncbi:hypothetical protein M422DRAFT_53076 [Sphaerobolus stellatus SS14]|uniref:Uncharacterized protein n=1 Tax=Sphaerobolus stellatus (strain SS14) TaxID=990650 RepID=A0A0C9UBP1_SPHS4|nr:hypothetical protein M422DRAFT_53076 [Sphaerobolus stellatus SS14]